MNKHNTTVSEKQNSSGFFTRTFEGIDFSDGKNVVKNYIINSENANHGSKMNLISIIEYKIKYGSFSIERTDNFSGLFIHCNRGDGISYLSEKNYKLCNSIISENKFVNSLNYNSTELIQKNNSDFHDIISLVGGKRKILRLAEKSELINNIKFFWGGALIIPFIGFVPNLFSWLEINAINIEIQTWLLYLIQVFIFISALFFKNLKYFAKKISIIKDRDAFIRKLLSDDYEQNTNYQPFITNVVEYILQKKTGRKVLIIDDIATLEQFSQDVLFGLIKLTNDSKRYFWIIFSSAHYNTEKIQSKYFYPLTLLPLNSSEKKEICNQLKKPITYADFFTIKEITRGDFDKGAQDVLKQELTTLKKLKLDLFNFIYLLSLNDFPRNSEYNKEILIKKIAPRRHERERDKFIKKIFTDIPDITRLKDWFSDEKIKKYLIYNTETYKFNIRNDLSYLITNPLENFYQLAVYRYGQGYWGLLWYFAYRDKPQTHKIQKISHHLREADCTIEDIDVRVKLLEANLFTADKSLSFLLKHEIVNILEHTLGALNIHSFTAVDIKKESITKIVCESFLNFGTTFTDKKNMFDDLGCVKLYDFINKKDLSAVNNILNDTTFNSVSGYMAAYLLEQYWEKCFFLYIFYKENPNYSLISAVSAELEGLTKYIIPYFENAENNTSPLYLFNLSVFIWINYIRLISNAETPNEEILIYIDDFLKCYNNINIAENDVYQQAKLQEAICLVSTVALLMLKQQNIETVEKLTEQFKALKIIFKEVELDVKKGFDEIQRFLLIHSLLWKNADFNERQTLISVVMTQLILFIYDNDIITGDIIAKADEITQITGNAKETRLSTLLNFSLYLNSKIFGVKHEKEHQSSKFFQKALKNLTDTDKISAFQFEYLYFAILNCWYIVSDELKNILQRFVIYSNPYFNSIVTKTCEYPNSYLYITNCLSKFKADELKNDKNDKIMVFFDRILKAVEEKGIKNFNTIECIWKNYKFGQLSKEEKLIEKHVFEDYWNKNLNNLFYGDALGMLLNIETNSIQQTLMDNCYRFIVESDRNNTFCSYNFNFRTACNFVNEKKKIKIQDTEYKAILNILDKFEPNWENNFSKMLNDSILLYKTLSENTEDKEKTQTYNEKLKHYEHLLKKVKVDNLDITDNFGFFCNLIDIFDNELATFDDISIEEKQLIKDGKSKQWLESIKKLEDVIRGNEISRKFHRIYSYRHEEFEGREELLKKCNDLSVNNFQKLCKLILFTKSNERYMERIKTLFEQVQENYDDE